MSKNRIVTVITGTRKGIGKYLAEYYHYLGHQIVGCSRAKPDWDLEFYDHFELDVADEKSVSKMVQEIKKKYGRIDNLINNAGIASMNHCLLTPLSTVNNILNTNVIGTFLFVREVAKVMSLSKVGRIVNFATVATPLKLEGEAIYAASKAAIVSLTEVLSRELSPFNITVNAVGPTPVETDLIRSVPQDKMDRLLDRQSVRRFGEFQDISNVIDFFIRPESNFVTGQTVYLGGV